MQVTNKQWNTVLKRVRKLGNLSVVEYSNWLERLQIETITPELFVICVPDEESLHVIESNYKEYFATAVAEVLDLQCEIRFEVDEYAEFLLATVDVRYITKNFIEVMKKKGWKYSLEADLSIEAGVSLSNRLKYCKIGVLIIVGSFYIYGTLGVKANAKTFTEVAKFLHYVNTEEVIGCFEIDYADGEIRYRVGAEYENEGGALPTQAMLERHLDLPIRAFEQYGDVLLDVIVGNKTAEKAYDEVN